MPVDKSITEYLDSTGVKYSIQSHEPAYTAQEVAAKAHVRGRDLAKVVILKADDKLVMAVVPSPRPVDLDKFAAVTGGKSLSQ